MFVIQTPYIESHANVNSSSVYKGLIGNQKNTDVEVDREDRYFRDKKKMDGRIKDYLSVTHNLTRDEEAHGAALQRELASIIQPTKVSRLQLLIQHNESLMKM